VFLKDEIAWNYMKQFAAFYVVSVVRPLLSVRTCLHHPLLLLLLLHFRSRSPLIPCQISRRVWHRRRQPLIGCHHSSSSSSSSSSTAGTSIDHQRLLSRRWVMP
jgi:hypothetical protein